MNKRKLIALRNTYYGRNITAGQSFEATPSHANLMVKCKAARYAEDATESEKRTYKRRDMKAER